MKTRHKLLLLSVKKQIELATEGIIYQKLEAFVRKFYTNELLKGILFFLGLGLVYFLFTLFVEYFLWLKPMGRTVLFWLFVGVELVLAVRLIFFPVFKLIKLQKGIDHKQASSLIGNHFPEVGDKLINFLQLAQSPEKSELLLASIQQKQTELKDIPFGKAINFRANKKYLSWVLLPIISILVFYVSGNGSVLFQSFHRVLHFNTVFSPPAPFQFKIGNASLITEQNKDFTLRVLTEGRLVPDKILIFINNESYYMQSVRLGEFQFKISQPAQDVVFHLEANTLRSDEYRLKVVAVPSISNFQMQLRFPSYLNKKSETIQGIGNASIPEGTQVVWKIDAQATQQIIWKCQTHTKTFFKKRNQFVLSKNIVQNTDYQIISSNLNSQQHEQLNYRLVVIKDLFPTIQIQQVPDSLKLENNTVLGQIADDYGLSKLQLVYYPKDKTALKKQLKMPIKKSTFDQFLFSFPGNLPVAKGVVYEYYFEVFDTDARHRFKRTQSQVFSSRVATADEKEQQVLQQQKDNTNGLEKALKNQKQQAAALEKLNKQTKEKDEFDFKDQQKIADFLKNQKAQEQAMQEFAEKMKQNLGSFQPEQKQETKQTVTNRLEKLIQESDKNQKLLNELQKLNSKIEAEEILEKLNNYKKQNSNQAKNLAQLVELTKRFYVEKKAEQLVDKLNKLANKQEQLANKGKENKAEKQEEINTDFNSIQKEWNELQQDNTELKSPFDLPKEETKTKNIKDDLKEALAQLKEQNNSKAQSKQKAAAQKMKEMAQTAQESSQSSETEQLAEDVKTLRQITDNLLAFSNTQETLMLRFKASKLSSPSFNKNIKIQQNLKQQFKHIDDSLFAMSLRNPMIGEEITKQLGKVEYNMDNAIESLSNSGFSKGVSHQQYVVSEANKLADNLSDMLFNMQTDLSGMTKGKSKPGQGKGMQLPDIIKKQNALSERMEQEKNKGEQSPKGKSQSNGEPEGEGDAEKIMQIYNEQQKLREALENELQKQGLDAKEKRMLDQMRQLEKQLINKGFKDETIAKAKNIQQELLKLKTAFQEQGEENKREATTNKNQFFAPSKELPKPLLEYFNSMEILNRQSLPLRSNFNKKVQVYFNRK